MEGNLILNLPLDEPDGSTVAYDYSKSKANGTVTGANFVFGKSGNCIDFSGAGKLEVENNSIPVLTGPWTVACNIKLKPYPDGFTGKKLLLLINYSGVDAYQEEELAVPMDEWFHIALVKNALNLTIYINGTVSDTIALTAQPVGWSLSQDIYGNSLGYGQIDNFQVYSTALSTTEVGQLLASQTEVVWSLNGKNFKDWGVYVQDSEGILDQPRMKEPFRVDWPDIHGEVIDLSRKRYEAREITLSCWLKATGKLDFANKLNHFLDQFTKDGTTRLQVDIHPTKPLLYEVYLEGGVAVRKRWRDDQMIGTFNLVVREPDPVKRVVMHQRFDSGSSTLTVTLNTTKPLTVYWGDGQVTNNVTGAQTLTHTYASNGRYYALIAGVLEGITAFTTNGVVVWSKL
ncbi:LamG-like jellyroll fold domain-containing protein [Leadbetterella byssophila]|uniref:LamG-like jellyroll fold domain-containing protein n=1 Tax=Leadbetterella byssophila TaxID=316068 RepID=UPI0039A08CE0